MGGHREDDDEIHDRWTELDRIGLRTSLADLIREMPQEYNERLPAMKDMLAIVLEEIAKEMSNLSKGQLMHARVNTIAGAQEAVQPIIKDMNELGLTVLHHMTKEECTLRVARTPSAGPFESCIEIVPVDPTTRTPIFRLPDPLPKLTFVPAQRVAQRRDAGPSR